MRYFLLLFLLLCACSREPGLRFEPSPEEIVSIAALKLEYRGYERRIDRELYIKGAIVSSDRDGNLRHSLVVQDSTGGIEIRAGMEALYRRYEQGATLLVRCNTLWLSDYGGSVQLGWGSDPIPEERLSAHLRITDPASREIAPQLLRIEQLAARWVNCRVRFEGMEVADGERELTWGEIDRNVDRHLVDARRDTLVVRIDATSEWAQMPMPQGSGAIEGILTWFNGYQLRPLSAADIQIRPN